MSKIRAALVSILVLPLAALAQHLPTPDVSALSIPANQPTSPGGRIAPQLLGAKGVVNVWVQLEGESLAAAAAGARNAGLPMTRDAQRAHVAALRDRHDELAYTARSLGGTELGRVSKAHNAVAFRIDAAQLPALAAHPGVLTVRPVIDYSIDLSETVPYIGAAAVQAQGVTGKGVRVAVLDSGIDYTHRNLKGSGNRADWVKAYGVSLDDPANKTLPDPKLHLFPTDKVVGGFDFVGERWPNPDPACPKDAAGKNTVCLRPDPNPIACTTGAIDPNNPKSDTCDGTHGTHVSDIIGGLTVDNQGRATHVGVAPGTQLYGVKVCSSVTTSCSGVALLQGIDFALDPNGNNDISDHVDVINMSLGSNFGQKEDDLTQASEEAVRAGVVVVAAAGNAADRPYIVSSPSIAPGAISAAQTQVPSAKFFPLIINSPATAAGQFNNTTTVDWAPINPGFTGNVAFVGRGCPAGSIATGSPEDPYLASPSGKVALIDRGACAVSLKVDRATKAGAIGVLIGLVAPGDPISFSFGGGDQPMAQTLIIIQADANRIKNATPQPANVTVPNRAQAPSLVKSMVSTSARGPSISFQTIKPELGAPGASVSAVAGTGTQEAAFGGTSGATPMIAGSAALLRQAFPNATPAEIKARLMNNAQTGNTPDTGIRTAPNLLPNEVAPATRIGAGEVRVNRALAARTLAFSEEDESATLSFGYAAVASRQEISKKVQVVNLTNSSRTYSVSFAFRDSANLGVPAVSVRIPSTLQVPKRGSSDLEVRLTIDPTKLQTWTLNGGSQGGNGPGLTALELDGLVTLSDRLDTITVPWSLVAHRSADVRIGDGDDVTLSGAGTASVTLQNRGATAGRVDVFAWTGSSKKISQRFLPKPGDNFAVIDLGQVGVRGAGSGTSAVVQFGINTFGKRATPNYPAEFDVALDVNQDGTTDFVIFNAENGGFGATGQNVVFVSDVRACPAGKVRTDSHPTIGFFFVDADLNSGRVVMTAPLSALAEKSVNCRDAANNVTPVVLPGLKADGTVQFNFSIFAFDNYFTGQQTDSIENMTFTLATPRFTGSGVPATGVPVGGSSSLTVGTPQGGDTASPSQKGLLLLYRDAAKKEAQTILLVQDDG